MTTKKVKKAKWGSSTDVKKASKFLSKGNYQLAPLPIVDTLEKAYYDWMTNDAYGSGGSNYRLKSLKGRIAPWNKIVKERYGTGFGMSEGNAAFHKDATEWAKTHSVISLKRLQDEEDDRSSISRLRDETQLHSVVLEPSSPIVKRWMRDPGSADIRGIDTPVKRQKKVKRGRRKTTPNPSMISIRK